MNESRRLAMRKAHTRYKGYCTCGKKVSGNGGKSMHEAMHARKQDAHHFVTYEKWVEMGLNDDR